MERTDNTKEYDGMTKMNDEMNGGLGSMSYMEPAEYGPDIAADIINFHKRGRRHPGMGTVTQYAYMRASDKITAYRNVPEWCAHRFVDAGPVPLDHCCAQIFADSNVAPHAAALDAGRIDFGRIHSCARYTECLGCPMLVGGNYKGVWMLRSIRRACRMTNGAKKNGSRGLNETFNLVNANCLHLWNKIIKVSPGHMDFWKWRYTGEVIYR